MQKILTKRGKGLLSSAEELERLVIFGFDVVEYNGEKLFEEPLKKRRTFLPNTETILPSRCKEFSYP